jgi:hypothetical protein
MGLSFDIEVKRRVRFPTNTYLALKYPNQDIVCPIIHHVRYKAKCYELTVEWRDEANGRAVHFANFQLERGLF